MHGVGTFLLGLVLITNDPLITIESGTLVGREAQDGVESFLGIPYAAPPTGERRWKPPAACPAWEGTRAAKAFGNACPQKTPALMALMPSMAINASQNEDCLFLNVWRPANSEGTLPVLVWIHGGAYVLGAASQPIYDGAPLARAGAVVVTINYRLGMFGFFAHPLLSQESPHDVSGNYGMLDQLAALAWVQRNIAAFGGDPNNVTIFGESAGGGSVLALLCSPMAKGLFHRAIIQSAPERHFAYLKRSAYGQPSAEQLGIDLLNQANLASTTLADLRALPAERLLDMYSTIDLNRLELNFVPLPLDLAPVVDGRFLDENVDVVFAEKRQHPVPLIVGCTRDEMTLFSMALRTPNDRAGYEAVVRERLGSAADAILAAYPVAEGSNPRATILRMLSDISFTAQARYTARMHAAAGHPTYLYQFSIPTKVQTLRHLGAHHAAEVAFVFGHKDSKWTAEDQAMSAQIIDYWVQFARTGNPNASGESPPSWPEYSAPKYEQVEFEADVAVRSRLREDQLDAADVWLGPYRIAP